MVWDGAGMERVPNVFAKAKNVVGPKLALTTRIIPHAIRNAVWEEEVQSIQICCCMSTALHIMGSLVLGL